MEEKIKRLLMWAKGKKTSPLCLELNITNRCNLKCKMCWLRNAKIDYSKELKDEELIRIVKEAIELKIKEFRIPGSGEPLMRKSILFKLMSRIKESGREGLLITNGTLFREEDVKRLLEMEWDVLTISLDGPNERINDFIRGKNSYRRVIRTLQLIKKWKKKIKTEKPWLRMNVVLTKKNFESLGKMVELAKRYEVKEVLIQPITVFSELGKKLKVGEKEREKVRESLKKVREKAKKLGIKTNVESFIDSFLPERTDKMEKVIEEERKKYKHKFLSSPCFEPWYNMVILPTGEVGPCAIFGGKDGIDIREHSLEEVWYNLFEKIRRRLLKGILFQFCSNCCVPIFLENKRIREKLSRLI